MVTGVERREERKTGACALGFWCDGERLKVEQRREDDGAVGGGL